MSRNADILNELKALDSRLASMSGEAPFALPEGYINGLAEDLAEGVHVSQMEEYHLEGLPKALPFDAPNGYFTGLAEGLLETVIANSLENGIASPLQTPPGYIEALPATLVAAVKNAESVPVLKGRVISVQQSWTRIGRIAAAALLVIGLGFGTYRYFEHSAPETATVKELSRLDASDIAAYVAQDVDDFETETLVATLASAQTEGDALFGLETSEILQYLEESGDTMPADVGTGTL